MPAPVFIGLGSNLGHSQSVLLEAIAALAQMPNTQVTQASSLYSSAPLGPADQPRYVNAVAQLATHLEPLDLLDQLQRIEQQFGRVREGERWGPRTLDLDILLYAERRIEHERLHIPHYHMHARPFVLYPLAEVCSGNLLMPDGRLLVDWLLECPLDTTLKRLVTPEPR